MGEAKIVPREHLLHALHRGEQVRDLRGRQVRQAGVRLGGAHEDVAWQEGLEVDEGEGVRGGEEDLLFEKGGEERFFVSSVRWWVVTIEGVFVGVAHLRGHLERPKHDLLSAFCAHYSGSGDRMSCRSECLFPAVLKHHSSRELVALRRGHSKEPVSLRRVSTKYSSYSA